MNLSDHFTLNEMIKSQEALRRGIKNDPDAPVIDKLRTLCMNVLEPIREHFNRPIFINSGFRCLRLNRAIGSKDNSQHLKGEAADIEIPGLDNRDLAEYINQNLNFDQLILEYYVDGQPDSGWVHVSYVNPNVNRKSFFRIP
jgi:uncharacterized protein YcbK (DUF882 family)